MLKKVISDLGYCAARYKHVGACEISSSHGGEYEDQSLLGYYTV
jgi:hypothetical protein